MDDLIQFWQQPKAEEMYLIAGWRQWADAGSISSGLPQYLIDLTLAEKIGQIRPNLGFYLFQIPGTHHLLRPVVKFEDGHRQSLNSPQNEFFYIGDEKKGLTVFLGDEPHMNVEQYANAFFQAVHLLNIKRVIVMAGVYGPVPYDQAREVGCIYSLPAMREELTTYAVRFSDYEGGASIGSYLIDRAEREGVEFLAFYAFVPGYDFSQASLLSQEMRIEHDYKAWLELLRRVNHMLDMGINLSDLEQRTQELIETMDDQISELEEKMPQLKAQAYLDKLKIKFVEHPFEPLDDVWEQGLRDLFDDANE